jgi:hypothetical protein
VGDGWDRYPLYRSCLETALAAAAAEPSRHDTAAGIKQRGHRHELRLDQRLRQPSRRRRRQGEPES